MIRLTLPDTDRDAVQALRRDSTLRPAERDRVEMVLLSAAGWSPPRIAAHLRCHAKTVRLVLVRFQADGLTSLRRRRPGPPPDVARRQQVEAALTTVLGRDRTWTAAQLAVALGEEFGIALSPRQTRKYLGRIAAWRRTVRTLRHKQDPAKVERAKAVLTSLKKRPPPDGSASCTSTNAASVPASR
jgi:putative transposase